MSKDFQNGFALGRSMGGVVTGGGTSLNIAYGDTPPDDTSKLWIKANEPARLTYGNDIEGVGRVELTGLYLSRQSNANTPGIARVKNKLYAFRSRNVSVFDLDTQRLTDLGDLLPANVSYPFCFVEGSEIYVLYSTSTPVMYVFNTETNEVSTHPQPPDFIKGLNAVAKVENKLYSLGGSQTKYIYTYDLTTRETTRLSVTMPETLPYMACESYGTKIYLFGGKDSTADGVDHIYVFDTETNTINKLTTALPNSCYNIGLWRIGSKIYLFGGERGSMLNTVLMFDITTEKIVTLEATLPQADAKIGCYADGTKIYLFGGDDYRESFNVFTLTHQLNNGDIEIETDLLKNRFNIINTDNAQVEIGVRSVYVGNESNEAECVDAFLYINGEWVQISFGKSPEPTGTYTERMYNHFGVDIAEFPYLVISVKDTLAYAFFFTGRHTDELGHHYFTKVRDLQIGIKEGSSISQIIKAFESRDSSALPSASNISMLSQELEGYTYYANFDYAELGYEGIGTWKTLEQGGESDG